MQRIVRFIPFWSVIALLVYMPFHIFLSQWLSTATGGLEAWKLGKDIILAALVLFSICLVYQQRCTSREFNILVGVAAGYGLLHAALWLLHPALFRDSALLGIIYNNRLLAFLLLGASAGLLLGRDELKAQLPLLRTVIITASTVVAVVGIVQYFLPKDILTHFGYSLDRGVRPNFFIDDNPAFPRIMSTLRDPNSLAAYLLLPLALLSVQLSHIRDFARSRQVLLAGLFAIHIAALYLTFARSAWLGAAVMFAAIIWWQFSSQFVHILRKWWPAGVILVLLTGTVLFTQRHNAAIDGVLTHSTSAQVGQYDSNEYHWLYVKRGLEGIWHNPLGHGPGTAGLASIQNPHGGLLTENYYVQIGYEVGVVGLAVFVGAQVWLYMRLLRGRDDWKVVLLASFWAYAVINMLLHMWSNEAVAAQWWLAAGVLLTVSSAGAGKPKTAKKPGGRSRATTKHANA
ncbi:MAG: O-antigen ligase family protein [Candidatus Saccharimonadales bacterium]